MVTEIGFVVLALVGFGMLSYAIANKLDKPSEFNESSDLYKRHTAIRYLYNSYKSADFISISRVCS